MSDLRIPITADLIVAMIRALDDATTRDDLHELLYAHGQTLCDIAGDVAAIRALERAAADRDLTEAEDAALHKVRNHGGTWLRAKAEAILVDIASNPLDDRAVCDASSVDDRPGQDAGEALVGIECLLWDGEWNEFMNPNFKRYVTKFENEKYANAADPNLFWDHARPVYLGLPEVAP